MWNIADGKLISQQTVDEAALYNYDQVFLGADGWHGFVVPREGDDSGYQPPAYASEQWVFDLLNDRLFVASEGYLRQEDGYMRVVQACVFPFSPGAQPPCQDVNGEAMLSSDGQGHFFSLWEDQQGEKVSLYEGLAVEGNALATFSTNGHHISLKGVSPNRDWFVYSLGGTTIQAREMTTGRVLWTEDTQAKRVQFTPDGLRMTITEPVLVYDSVQNSVQWLNENLVQERKKAGDAERAKARKEGITDEDKKKVFDRFFLADEGLAREDERVGIGLYVSREIVRKHGGDMWFESREGAGSTFHFSLPLKQK